MRDLVGVIDQLAAQDVTTLPLVDDLTVLETQIARLQAEAARPIAAMSATAEHHGYGYKTIGALLQARLRMHPGVAHAAVRVAKDVRDLPLVADAWQSGAITTKHAELIANARHDEQFAQAEATFVAITRTRPPKDLADALVAWRDALDAALDRDGSERRDVGELERNSCMFSQTLAGRYVGQVDLDAAGGEILATALQTAYDQLHRERDPRSPARQRADAIVEIARTFLACQPGRANLPHVLVLHDIHTILDTIVGESKPASGARISPDTAKRLACDAFAQHVLLDTDMVPLAMGRAVRTFTPDQYRAMVIRDGGCRGPGCNAPPARCQGHHLHEWVADHGNTDLDAGALFCWACHPDLHEGGMTIKGDPNSALHFYDHNGNHLGTTHPRHPPPQFPIT